MGSGVATAFEKSVFNVPNDIKFVFDVPVSIGWIHNFDAHRALCVHTYGGSPIKTRVDLSGPGGPQTIDFMLDAFNLGVRYRHTFTRGILAPYVFAGFSAASGTLKIKGTPDLEYNGASGCVGTGASVGIGRHIMVSAEGLGSIGVSSWQRAPFSSSSGRKFNPSMVSAMIHVSYVWGERD